MDIDLLNEHRHFSARCLPLKSYLIRGALSMRRATQAAFEVHIKRPRPLWRAGAFRFAFAEN